MGGHHNTTKAFNYELTGSQLYEAPHKLGTRAPQWLPEPRCRTSDKQPTPSGQTTWHDDGDGKDGGRRSRRQTKTETVEDEDSLTLGTGELAAPLQLTTPPSEHRT